MSNRALLASFIALSFALPVTVHAQAAAESALTHALSSSATVKAGSTFSHALNQSSTQLGARIQQRTSSPAHLGAQPKTSRAGLGIQATSSLVGSGVRTGSSPGMSAVSIQGGEGACISASPAGQAVPATSKGGPSINCGSQKSAPKPGTTEDKYKSFVTLPFPK